jgi:hypothetical protein
VRGARIAASCIHVCLQHGVRSIDLGRNDKCSPGEI